MAVSWHGPRKVNKASKKTKLEVFCDFIRLLRVVCEKEELSSFIIGGDFNFNTSKVDRQTKYGVTISRYKLCTRDKEQRGPSFVPYKDTFIISVPSDKRLMTGDITVSSVAPLELENESGENALLDHVPVVGDLEVVWPSKKPSIKQDKGKLEQKFKSCTFQPTVVYNYMTKPRFFRFRYRSSQIRKHRYIRTFQKQRNVRIENCKHLHNMKKSYFKLFQSQNILFVIQIFHFFQMNNIVHCSNTPQIFLWT